MKLPEMHILQANGEQEARAFQPDERGEPPIERVRSFVRGDFHTVQVFYHGKYRTAYVNQAGVDNNGIRLPFNQKASFVSGGRRVLGSMVILVHERVEPAGAHSGE
jgi:hypothetical protein